MPRKTPPYGLLGVLAGTAAAVVYVSRVRPWFLRWGATESEIERDWPGRACCPCPETVATRAITIHAPAKDVWAWILQIGQDRGGFQSYTWLENLFGCEMHNADRILPECQHREVGDTVWLAPRQKYGGNARMRVAWLEPERAMVLIMPEDAETVASGGEAEHGFWGFYLEPIDEKSCRLVMVSRSGRRPPVSEKLAQRMFWEPAHFIMERKMMLRIKQLAEQRR